MKIFMAKNQRWTTLFQSWFLLKRRWTAMIFDGFRMKISVTFFIFFGIRITLFSRQLILFQAHLEKKIGQQQFLGFLLLLK